MEMRPHPLPVSRLEHLLVDLLSTAPGLVPLYREHLAMHDALLPELFMSQVTGWLSGTVCPSAAHTVPLSQPVTCDMNSSGRSASCIARCSR